MDLQKSSFHILNKITDILILCFCFVIGFYSFKPNVEVLEILSFLVVLIVVWIFSSNTISLYDDFRTRSFIYEVKATINNGFIQLITFVVLLFFSKQFGVSRLFVIVYPASLVFLILLKRFIIKIILRYWRAKGHNIRRMVIVGMGEVGVNFYYTVRNTPHLGIKIVGFFDDGDKGFQTDEFLGSCEKLESVLENQAIDDVVICLPNHAADKISQVIKICEKHTTRVKIIPDYFRFDAGKYDVSLFGKFPIISLRTSKLNLIHWRILKRAFDILFTGFLFITLFWWTWFIIACAIKISSPGPVFYKQLRWGRKNKKFLAWKFRSMRNNAGLMDENGRYKQAQKNDPRVTKIGRFLRKTSLDELPQFINVLVGDMSIIGPRPHPIPLNLESKDRIEHYMLRHLIKPGISGWAQINGFRGSTKDPELMQKRINHDIWYIENWSFLLDMQIIFLTLWNLFKGDPNAY